MQKETKKGTKKQRKEGRKEGRKEERKKERKKERKTKSVFIVPAQCSVHNYMGNKREGPEICGCF